MSEMKNLSEGLPQGVEEIKESLQAERGMTRELRADKGALQGQNARLHETDRELRERVLLLGRELEIFQTAGGEPVEIKVNKYRAGGDDFPPAPRARKGGGGRCLSPCNCQDF